MESLGMTWKRLRLPAMIGGLPGAALIILGEDVAIRESNVNPVYYASLDTKTPVQRRVVVNRDKCNACHENLGGPTACRCTAAPDEARSSA